MQLDWLTSKVATFVSGLITGGGITYLVLDEVFKKKEDDLVMRYNKAIEASLQVKKYAEEHSVDYLRQSEKTDTGRENGVLSADNRVRIKTLDTWTDTGEKIDYAKFYVAKNDSRVIDEPEMNRNTVDVGADYDIEEEQNTAMKSDRGPRISTEQEVKYLPKAFERHDLKYFMYSDTLIFVGDELENDREIEDIESVLGNCLTQNGFDHNDDDKLFVVDFSKKQVYIVEKEWNNFIK